MSTLLVLFLPPHSRVVQWESEHIVLMQSIVNWLCHCLLQETEELLERLHNYKSDYARKALAASNLAQYDELKECTFTPVINQSAPKHTVRCREVPMKHL